MYYSTVWAGMDGYGIYFFIVSSLFLCCVRKLCPKMKIVPNLKMKIVPSLKMKIVLNLLDTSGTTEYNRERFSNLDTAALWPDLKISRHRFSIIGQEEESSRV